MCKKNSECRFYDGPEFILDPDMSEEERQELGTECFWCHNHIERVRDDGCFLDFCKATGSWQVNPN